MGGCKDRSAMHAHAPAVAAQAHACKVPLMLAIHDRSAVCLLSSHRLIMQGAKQCLCCLCVRAQVRYQALGLPMQLIHGDLHYDNVMVLGDAVSVEPSSLYSCQQP